MPDAERKVRQLDADVHEIYDLLRSLDANVRDIGARVLRQESRLNQIEGELHNLVEGQQAMRSDIATILALLQPPADD